ncbi:GNAT family N-acetyltransferase [Sphingomonas cavernae]|uniref:N-acetyltransferase n=1 Tax=Sphingomonas cavernae TaxID=2320861 RepID=A0A418WR70_9SPHN|nr:GNAT family N-acetyltransferase [Sphingomonas cavernae]RJF93754.1 N-acetyltransferase [Sphingomonas cavernae]
MLPDGYVLSDDAATMQVDAIHAYLARSYWSPGIPRETVTRAIANSLCVGVFRDGAQVGFARVVTDRATFAYLADVYVLEAHQGRGLAHAMVEHLQQHPELQGLRRWMLATNDAHGLYASLGWEAVADPSKLMMRHFPDVYGATGA